MMQIAKPLAGICLEKGNKSVFTDEIRMAGITLLMVGGWAGRMLGNYSTPPMTLNDDDRILILENMSYLAPGEYTGAMLPKGNSTRCVFAAG
jgi:hypothetical protein